MASLAEYEYSPDSNAQYGASWRQIYVDGESIDLLTTNDFPSDDPWSVDFREAVAALWRQTHFSDQSVWEFGVGDGRNLIVARGIRGVPLRKVHGIDIDDWRLDLAAGNLERTGISGETPVSLFHMHALDYLRALKDSYGNNSLKGVVLMCLPQSPEGGNSADTYDQSGLGRYRLWDIFGLSLNAAVLDNLQPVAHRETIALVMLSGRVPEEIRLDMLHTTGWSVEQEFGSLPVQQDPDTGIRYVEGYATEGVFWEVDEYRNYQPISTAEAIRRWEQCRAYGGGRDTLNVFHTVHEYLISPRKGLFG